MGGMGWKNAHLFTVDHTWDLERELGLHLLESSLETGSLGGSRSIVVLSVSIGPAATISSLFWLPELTMGSLWISGILKAAS